VSYGSTELRCGASGRSGILMYETVALVNGDIED
jgi:hypothetical protein